MTPVKEVLEKQDEAEWCLRDVIFVEDSKTVPVGKVVKVLVFHFHSRAALLKSVPFTS